MITTRNNGLVAGMPAAPVNGTSRYLRLGVRQKVVLILAATLLLTLTANSGLALRDQERDILSEVHRRGAEIAQFIADYLAYSMVGHDYHTIELLIRQLGASADVAYAKVVSAKGNTITVTGNTDGANSAVAPFVRDIRLRGEKLGEVHIGLSTERIVGTLREQRRASIMRQFLVILIVMLVELAALSYIIIRPLTVMSRVVGAGATPENVPVKAIPIGSADEFGDVARQFNDLHGRLNEANARLQERVELANGELRQANERLRRQTDRLTVMNRELEQLAITDPLTGLFNRRHFEATMDSEVENAIRHDETRSIILADIDHFKQYNDRYGHHVGDEILRQVAAILRAGLRPGDIACRYGGDEFFVLCRGATIAGALTLAMNLLQAASATTFTVGTRRLPLTLSVGVATIPGVRSVSNADDFFRCADTALAYSKRHGRNQVTHFAMLDRCPRL